MRILRALDGPQLSTRFSTAVPVVAWRVTMLFHVPELLAIGF